ncbi:unnamed protein product, partial [marine sediment metagenome]
PKTGQIVSYDTGDDGEHEIGWWLGLVNGVNRIRFIEKEPVEDEKVIIVFADNACRVCNYHFSV